jgi:anti-sigma regulatory factor (Ser/Thr protein kinase)
MRTLAVRVKLCLMIAASESGYGGMEAEVSAEVVPGPGAAAEARRALEGLGDLLSPGKLEDVRLLVSELVTNSVLHAGLSPDEAITVTVTVQGGLVRGEVHDRGPGFEPPQELRPKPDLASGWGLYIVERMADRWGVAHTGSKSVWFEIDLKDD